MFFSVNLEFGRNLSISVCCVVFKNSSSFNQGLKLSYCPNLFAYFITLQIDSVGIAPNKSSLPFNWEKEACCIGEKLTISEPPPECEAVWNII